MTMLENGITEWALIKVESVSEPHEKLCMLPSFDKEGNLLGVAPKTLVAQEVSN